MAQLPVSRFGSAPTAAIVLLLVAMGCARATVSSPTQRVSPREAPSLRPQLPAPADIVPGTRIRYRVTGDWRGLRTGHVARVNADTIWLTPARPLPMARLRRLEISLGGATEEQRLAWGAGIGAAAGILAGVLIPRHDEAPRYDAPATRTGMILYLGAIGGVYGGLLGLLVPGEKWQRVDLTANR